MKFAYLPRPLFFFPDSNKSMSDVLLEFKDGGRLRSYNPDGVSRNANLQYVHTQGIFGLQWWFAKTYKKTGFM